MKNIILSLLVCTFFVPTQAQKIVNDILVERFEVAREKLFATAKRV